MKIVLKHISWWSFARCKYLMTLFCFFNIWVLSLTTFTFFLLLLSMDKLVVLSHLKITVKSVLMLEIHDSHCCFVLAWIQLKYSIPAAPTADSFCMFWLSSSSKLTRSHLQVIMWVLPVLESQAVMSGVNKCCRRSLKTSTYNHLINTLRK